jgi:hypothetical protein
MQMYLIKHDKAVRFKVNKTLGLQSCRKEVWELSHIAEQHPTESTDVHGYDKQQPEGIKAERSTYSQPVLGRQRSSHSLVRAAPADSTSQQDYNRQVIQ